MIKGLKLDPGSEHLVSDGRVFCLKVRKDVSVETCWMCERLVGFDIDDGREIVRCIPGRPFAELVPPVP